MPVTGFEVAGSRSGGTDGFQRKYFVQDADSANGEDDVVDWIDQEIGSLIPEMVGGYPLAKFGIQEVSAIDGTYEVSVDYSRSERTPSASASIEYRFNFQAQGFHAYQSIATVGIYAAEDNPFGPSVNFHGALNVTTDGETQKQKVEGFAIPVPPEVFTLAYFPVNATVSETYQLTLENLCGCVNSETFRGRPAGSVMLVRVSGGIRTDEDWSIEFGFGYSPNQTAININGIIIPSKRGFDLMWPWYFPTKDEDTKLLIQNPQVVMVEQVYRYADLNALNLPA